MKNQFIQDFWNGVSQFGRLLSHSFLLFFRNSLRYRSYFLINILGLSAGLASTFLIYLWVEDELSVDAFYQKSEQIYQIFESHKINHQLETFSSTPVPLLETLENEFPEVEKAVAIFPPENDKQGIISHPESSIRFKVEGQYVSPDFFEVFSHSLLTGDPQAFQNNKRAVFISRPLAKKLFKGENPLGKFIEWDYQSYGGNFQVAGVFAETPKAARMQFDVLFHWDLILKERPNLEHWYNSYPDTYVLLSKEASPEQFNAKIKNLEQTKDERARGILLAQKYRDGYLYGSFENGQVAGGRIAYVRLFSIIALFILLISCINFMNLATARASRRLKEIGVKKALGAHRGLLIMQYLGESLLMTSLAFILALGWIY
ncbi:MAG: ABC transporter permease, partial [Bacteroidota bacterium]